MSEFRKPDPEPGEMVFEVLPSGVSVSRVHPDDMVCGFCGVQSVGGHISHMSDCPQNPKVVKAQREKERKDHERWIFWHDFRSWWDAERVAIAIIFGVTGIFVALIETGVVK